VFVPMVQRTLTKHRIADPEYEKLLSSIQSNSTLADCSGAGESGLRTAKIKNNEPFVTDRNSNNKNLQVSLIKNYNTLTAQS